MVGWWEIRDASSRNCGGRSESARVIHRVVINVKVAPESQVKNVPGVRFVRDDEIVVKVRSRGAEYTSSQCDEISTDVAGDVLSDIDLAASRDGAE